jgi:hypothetical protein
MAKLVSDLLIPVLMHADETACNPKTALFPFHTREEQITCKPHKFICQPTRNQRSWTKTALLLSVLLRNRLDFCAKP